MGIKWALGNTKSIFLFRGVNKWRGKLWDFFVIFVVANQYT